MLCYLFRHIWTGSWGKFLVYVCKHRFKCKYHTDAIQISQNKLLSFITGSTVSTRGLDMKCRVCLTTSRTKGYHFLLLRCVLSFWEKKRNRKEEQILHCLEMSSNRCIAEFNSYFIFILFYAGFSSYATCEEGNGVVRMQSFITVWLNYLCIFFCFVNVIPCEIPMLKLVIGKAKL